MIGETSSAAMQESAYLVSDTEASREWLDTVEDLLSSDCSLNGVTTGGTWEDLDGSEVTRGGQQHNLVEPGAIGAEFQALQKGSLKALPKPEKDPYHGRSLEPKGLREPQRESFNVMVVGEAGLGKTTLLESFFKSFQDDDAAFALFERRETHKVIETRRLLDEVSVRRDAAEREMQAAVEKTQYTLAQKKKAELAELSAEVARVTTSLRELCASDERKRNELRTLRERARELRWEMKRAADEQSFAVASEKQSAAEVLQLECDALQAELKQMRRRNDADGGPREGEDEEEDDDGRPQQALTSSTVRVTRFDPFSISVGTHELSVTLVDTPGYGDAVNAEESFDVICSHVEDVFNAQLRAEMSSSARDAESLRHDDPLVHVCLYFIAPHRLKHIDVAFMRRLHRWVNIVPIIAKSDTMTTKEKEEFKMSVREALGREGIQAYEFDTAVIRQMEQQDRQEYKHPWAVVGSTDAHLDAGSTVYLRKYPWGNALSSEPAHSDLPALRNLLMWSGQWYELKTEARAKYEQWRASRSTPARLGTATSSACGAAKRRLVRAKASVAKPAAKACAALGVTPRPPSRRTALAMFVCLLAVAGPAAWARVWRLDASAPRKLQLAEGRLSELAAEKIALVQTYEGKLASLASQLDAYRAKAEVAEASLSRATEVEAVCRIEKRRLIKSTRLAEQRADTAAKEAAAAKEGSTCHGAIFDGVKQAGSKVNGWASNTTTATASVASAAGEAVKNVTAAAMAKATGAAWGAAKKIAATTEAMWQSS